MDSSLSAILPFVDPAALAIVGGGTLAATMLRTPLRDVGRGLSALRALPRRRFRADPLIEQVAALGRIARRHGPMALDRSVIADPDVALAVSAIVDGGSGVEVEALLAHAHAARIERHLGAAEMWTGMADVAPGMGMIGTLVGLVGMFAAMRDPSAIGGAMAVALLTTLYGAIVANLIAAPVANRLRRRAREEAFERERIVAPLAALADREAPRRVVPPVELSVVA